MNSLTEHCETGLPISMWEDRGSDWAPVCQICCCHVNESHLFSLSCWGQAVVLRSWDTKYSSVWFMKFLNKLEELPDLERMGWFRKHNASTKSSERNPPSTFALKAVSLGQSDQENKSDNASFAFLLTHRTSQQQLLWKERQRGKAMLGYNAVWKLKRREKSWGVWIASEGLFVLRDTWWGNRKYGTKATKKGFGLPSNTWTDAYPGIQAAWATE